MRIRTVLLFTALLIVPAASAIAQSGTLTPQDYLDIQLLYSRYNMAVDGSDAKMMETVFTPDGEFLTGGKPRPGRSIVAATAAKKDRPQVRHMASSVNIVPSPEGARGSSYLMLVNLQATPPAIMGGGYYEDVLIKTPEGWRFKTRAFYSQATPAAPAAAASSSPR